MAELKTKATKASVTAFLTSIEPAAKREDGFALLEMFEKVTGEKAVLWGASIIGFGTYHYKSEKSRQEGDWPLVGFSPRKQNLALYVLGSADDESELLNELGKHKTGVGCLYINKLGDVDRVVLTRLIKSSFEQKKKSLT